MPHLTFLFQSAIKFQKKHEEQNALQFYDVLNFFYGLLFGDAV